MFNRRNASLVLLILVFCITAAQAQPSTPTPDSTSTEPASLTITPDAGAIGTSHAIFADDLPADTTYRLDVVYQATEAVVFTTEVTVAEDGFVISLISEPGDELGEYDILLYEGETLVAAGVMTITEPTAAAALISGEPISGEFTSGAYSVDYTFTAEAGDFVSVELTSPDVDTYLLLRNASAETLTRNDNSSGSDAEIIAYAIPETGTYIVTATSRAAVESSGVQGETGAYTLTLDIAVEAQDGDSINAGDTITGTLDEATLRAGFVLTGVEGEVVTIRLAAEGFDPLVILTAPDGQELIRDDDSGPGLFAQITEYELPLDGDYTIVVDGYRGLTGQLALSGAFVLSVETAGAAQETQPAATLEASAATEAQTIAYGDTINGELPAEAGDVVYSFTGQGGDVVTISLESDAFDPILVLQNADGGELTRNDDSGTGINSLIEGFELPENGEYQIVVDGYRGPAGTRSISGAFTLSLNSDSAPVTTTQESTPTPEPDVTAEPTAAPTTEVVAGEGGALVYGDVLEGELTPDVQALEYRFTGEAGEIVTISLSATDFDPSVRLLLNGEELTRDDDSGTGLNALIEGYALPEPGDYTILVEGYRGVLDDRVLEGVFQLALSEGEAAARETTPTAEVTPTLVPTETPPATTVPAVDRGEIVPGSPINDVIEGEGAVTYTFTGQAEDVVTISLDSTDFDPYLRLLDGDSNELAVDDDSGGSLQAQIVEFALPQDGTYTIEVSAFTGFNTNVTSTGEFTLLLETTGTTAAATAETESTPTTADLEFPPADAQAIVYGETVTAELAGEPAVYQFEAAEGDVISVHVTSDLDTQIDILNPDGSLFAYSDDDGEGENPEIRSRSVSTAGTYTLYLRPYFEGASGTAEFTLNNEVLIAAIEPGTPVVVALSDKNPQRTLTFEGTADEEVTISLRTLSTLTDTGSTPTITVTQGEQVIATNSVGLSARQSFTFVVPEDGQVEVSFNQMTSANVLIEITLEP